MKMHPCYFRDMLANKHEMTICDLGASMGVMSRDMLEKLCLPDVTTRPGKYRTTA
jgi:hypothetical protein